MIIRGSLAGGTAMPGLSTDQIALSVNRFTAQRSSLMSRTEASEEGRPAGAPVPPELTVALNRRSRCETHTSQSPRQIHKRGHPHV
jgi:hypothetical protein